MREPSERESAYCALTEGCVQASPSIIPSYPEQRLQSSSTNAPRLSEHAVLAPCSERVLACLGGEWEAAVHPVRLLAASRREANKERSANAGSQIWWRERKVEATLWCRLIAAILLCLLETIHICLFSAFRMLPVVISHSSLGTFATTCFLQKTGVRRFDVLKTSTRYIFHDL